ncbi:MAG: hypothetical protein RSA99_01475 [Oscillospiraceae bacterium]
MNIPNEIKIDKTIKTTIIEWLKSYATDCDREFCGSCNFAELCDELENICNGVCAPKIIAEILEK